MVEGTSPNWRARFFTPPPSRPGVLRGPSSAGLALVRTSPLNISSQNNSQTTYSSRALSIMRDVRERSDEAHLVFRSPRGKPLSNTTLS